VIEIIGIGIAASLLLFGFIAKKTNYWELDSKCLRIRKLRMKRDIPWNEVTDVGWLGNRSGTIRVNIGHNTADYDRLYLEPDDLAGLIAELRKFAPHAEFEIESVGYSET
jgi:hypothetical protein